MKLLNRIAMAALLVVASITAHAAAGPWVISNAFKSRILNGTSMNITSDTIKVALVTSSSNIASGPADCYTGGTGTALNNEVGTTNTGYTSGGNTLTSPGISGTSTVTYDTSDVPAWTAGSANLTARYAVMYDNTAASKTIIAYALLDSTPADVTTTSGNTLTIQIANVFSLAMNDPEIRFALLGRLTAFDLAMAANDPVYLQRALGW